MEKGTDEWIEDALKKIRADFKERGNETGLEILDNYKQRWDALGKFSERQIDWIKKQLEGSWKKTKKEQSPEDSSQKNPGPQREADILDVLVKERLAEEGKALIDLEQIGRLKRKIYELNDLLSCVG